MVPAVLLALMSVALPGWGRPAQPDRGSDMSERSGRVTRFESVEYTTQGGADLGFGLHERETRLRVDLDTRVAFLNRHQPTSTEGGEAIGTFRATLSPDLVSRLQEDLARADLGQIPSGNAGGPGTSLIRIRALGAAKDLTASFSSRDMATLDKLESLLSLLDDTVGLVAQHPFQAIRLELQVQHTPSRAFVIKIENVGTETVAIPDLEMLSHESRDQPDHGIGVRVAANPPERPGYTTPPLRWSRVEAGPADGPHAHPLLLPPGGARDIYATVWAESCPSGQLLAQAFFSFYAGPAVVDGHLMMRGHALSTGLDLAR